MLIKRIVIPVVAAAILPLVLLSVSAVVKGRITDPEGRPLAEVKITFRDVTRGHTFTAKTNKKGDYYLMGLLPADYSMRVEKPGYLPLEGKVFISVEKENEFNAVLAPEVPAEVKPAWEKLNLEANDLYRQGKIPEALALYEKILADDPGNAAILFNAGNCLFQLGRYDDAIVSYTRAIAGKPEFLEAYTNLANAYARAKKPAEGVAFFEQAVRAFPGKSVLLSSLGLLYLNSGQADMAIEVLEKAAALDPANGSSFQSLGIAYTQLGNYAKAVENYEKSLAMTTDPKEVDRLKTLITQLKALVKNAPVGQEESSTSEKGGETGEETIPNNDRTVLIC